MSKSTTKVAKPSKAESKAVKNSGITKASQTPKAKAKESAKATAKNIEKKKKKKVVEPESSDDSDSDEEEDSDDSDSDESEEEAPKKAAPKANGKKAKAEESDDSDSDEEEDSEDSDSDEEEKAAPKANGAAKKAAEDSDEDSEDSDDSDSDEEEEKAAPKTNGAKKDADSDEDSDDSDDSDDEEEEETKAEAPSKKRKAEEEIDEAPKKAKADVDAPTTLFAGSLSWGVDDDALYEAFKSFGNLVGARVVTDKNTGRSRGFGYVDFSDSESATKAYEAMQGQEIDGRALNLDYANAKPAEANPQNRAADRAKRHGDTLSAESDTLFVGNLPFEVDQDSVREFFSEVAEVASIRLPTDPESGNLKGFGYVTFNSIEDAKSALDAKNGSAIGNGRMSRAVRLDFAGSRPPQSGGGGGFGGRGGGRGGFGGRGGGRGGPRGGGGRGGFGGRGGGRGGFNSPRGGGFSGTKVTFD